MQGSGLVSLLADAKADYSDFEDAVASNWAKKYDLLWSLWTQHCDWKVGRYIHRAITRQYCAWKVRTYVHRTELGTQWTESSVLVKVCGCLMVEIACGPLCALCRVRSRRPPAQVRPHTPSRGDKKKSHWCNLKHSDYMTRCLCC